MDDEGRAFLRIQYDDKRLGQALVEVLPDGSVGRDIGIGRDGELVYVTRACQAEIGGPWEFWDVVPPSDPRFEENWPDSERISRDEFERIYREADETLPWTWGGVPTWISAAVSVVVLLAVVAVLAFVVVEIAHLFGAR